MLTLILFIVGFYILIKGASILIDGATSIAKKLGVSAWVIGLTIVGIGTSIPEFSITFISNLVGESDVGLGTIIGSNTFNILFILGLSALLRPILIKKRDVGKELILNIASVIIVILLAFGGINQLEAVILLALFILWMYQVVKTAPKLVDSQESFPIFTVSVSIFMIIAGLAGVILGARWVVDGAVFIANLIGVKESLVSLTAIAIGTSIPELTVSVVAALRGNPGLSVGNVIGSNIFDFLGIIGLSSLFKPIFISQLMIYNAIGTILAATLLFSLIIFGRRTTLGRLEGGLMIVSYLAYFGYLAITLI